MEAQIDRLVGPTHHFGGLGVGNLASQAHRGKVANPRAAAVQGLDKMATVARLGVPQFVLPPQRRPRLDWLRRFGFRGSDADVLARARDEAPTLLSAATSCSAMWTANAATVTPSWDAAPGRLTATVANLTASLHRSIEAEETAEELRRLLPAGATVGSPLPGGTAARDEGAANQMRLAGGDRGRGLHLLVFGDGSPEPRKYLPRQTREASSGVARIHRIPPENVFLLKQHPDAIDAGAFHNDVVAASHGDLLIHHELAFHDGAGVGNGTTTERLEQRFLAVWNKPLRRVVVGRDELPIGEAVSSYLFNSQIVTPGEDPASAVLICPNQVRECPPALSLVERWRDREGLFADVRFVELRQSMSAGGGPACLRLRVPVTAGELSGFARGCRWTERLDGELRSTIEASYPAAVSLQDLADVAFVEAAEEAVKRIRTCLGFE